MPEPVVTDPKEEIKEKPPIVEIREKSFQQLIKEQNEERANPPEPIVTEEEKAAKAKEEADKQAKADEEAKAKQEADRKAAEEKQAQIAKAAADEVIKKQEEAKQAELDRIKLEEAEKARQEALKPKFTGADEKGNVTPKDYEEIALETKRITKAEMWAELEAREKAKTEAIQKEAQEKAAAEEQIKARQRAQNDYLQTVIDRDLDAIYRAGDLPKIKVQIKDPNNKLDPGFQDEGYKQQKHLFDTAREVNTRLMAKGQPLIHSPQIIRYGKDPETGKPYYTPLAKPAGHDAPVLGNESSISNEAPEDRYIPARDRNKSMAQLIKEEAARMVKKMGIRSN